MLWPNEEISKGFETVRVLMIDGKMLNGFILDETDDSLSLGVATDDGKGERIDLAKDDIDERREMKASSMPEGLVKTIAPSEFLDLIQFLSEQLVGEDNWIATGQAKQKELRTHGELVELSRDAKLKIGADYPKHWNQNAHLTLSAVGANDREFAIHSPEPPVNTPAVIIRLDKPSEIRHIEIQNRRNSEFHARAADLAVWVSKEGVQWEQVWKSSKPAAQYSIDLKDSIQGQFLKVGLDETGILHLNQIIVFGK